MPSAPAAAGSPGSWPAIAAASAHDPGPRLPFWILEAGRPRRAGSVARRHLAALAALAELAALARWPQALRLQDDAVLLQLAADQRSDFFTEANRQLQAAGLIRGWRDETYPVLALDDDNGPPRLLATLERAAARFWGTLTFGAHCNGYVAGADGRPAQLWIARRAANKPTDPGLLDNLVGGGVPHGQSPADAVLREGWEEAGLAPAQMAGLQAGRRLRITRDVAEGLQREELSVFDLALPPGLVPHNQDGEVQSLQCLPVHAALALAAAGEMTVDAALVTLDFALRHSLLPHAEAQRLAAASQGLWLGPAQLHH